jgi:hypothetical protein
MNTVSTLQVMSSIIIAWSDPDNGGESIDGYEIQLLAPNNIFVNDPTCTGVLANGNLCVFSN